MKKDFNNEEQRQAAEDARTAALIQEQLDQEAAEIEKELAQNPELAGMKPDDSVKEKLRKRIEEYESRQAVSHLSPEDQEALRLGRKLQEEKNRKGNRRIIRIMKRTAGIAAVVAIVAAVGITGVGGPARVMEVLQQAVGGRKLTTVNSDDKDILEFETSEEEDAYQEIKDKLGIDPVRIIKQFPYMTYVDMQLDENMKIANIFYQNGDKIISYIINSSYEDSVWGIDIEDTLLQEYTYSLNYTQVLVQKYKIGETKEIKYSAKFDYADIHYQLIGIMTQNQLEEILDNLYFL